MSLGSDVAAALPELQAQAESTMYGECVIRRTVAGEWNEELGEYEAPTVTVVYSGICEPKFRSPVVREIDAQGKPGAEQEPTLNLPLVASSAVRVNDAAEITAHRFDAALVGIEARISGVHGGAVSARRFPVEITTWES